MANRLMTGATCADGQVLTFVAGDTGVAVNNVYQSSDGQCIQITATGNTTTLKETVTFVISFGTSCSNCLAPYSANTEQTMCYLCNSDINNGTATWNTYVPQHPKWTTNQGHTVIQSNAVTIGGTGLNS